MGQKALDRSRQLKLAGCHGIKSKLKERYAEDPHSYQAARGCQTCCEAVYPEAAASAALLLEIKQSQRRESGAAHAYNDAMTPLQPSSRISEGPTL